MEQVKQHETTHLDTCKEKNLCELFARGQCDGSYPCPKNDSPR